MIIALALLLMPPALLSAPAERSPGDRICEAYRGWLTEFQSSAVPSRLPDSPIGIPLSTGNFSGMNPLTLSSLQNFFLQNAICKIKYQIIYYI